MAGPFFTTISWEQTDQGTTSDKPLIGMKQYLFKLSKQINSHFIAFAILTILLGGCGRITSADVSGIYRRSRDGVVDTIILAPSGTFQQTITFTNGEMWTNSGSWKFSGQVVEFDKFYEAFEIDPDPNKVDAVMVIPPKLGANEVLWVENGRLLKNSVQPIWSKQQATN